MKKERSISYAEWWKKQRGLVDVNKLMIVEFQNGEKIKIKESFGELRYISSLEYEEDKLIESWDELIKSVDSEWITRGLFGERVYIYGVSIENEIATKIKVRESNFKSLKIIPEYKDLDLNNYNYRELQWELPIKDLALLLNDLNISHMPDSGR